MNWSKINTDILEVLSKLYPDYAQEEALFLRVSQGQDCHYTSDIAFSLAKGIGCPPGDIARTIQSRLATKSYAVTEVNGFLNFKLQDLKKVSLQFDVHVNRQVVFIGTYFGARNIRLLSLALFQTVLHAAHSDQQSLELVFESMPPEFSLWRNSFAQVYDYEEWSAKGNSAEGLVIVTDIPVSAFAKARVKEYGNDRVRFPLKHLPSRSWIESSSGELFDLDDTKLSEILWYYSSPIDAEHLDRQVPEIEESANIFWFLRSVLRRLARFQTEEAFPDKLYFQDLSVELQELLIAIESLSLLEFRAVLYGEVIQLVSHMSLLLKKIVRTMNAPALHSAQDSKPQELEVLRHGAFVLDGILNRWSSGIQRIVS